LTHEEEDPSKTRENYMVSLRKNKKKKDFMAKRVMHASPTMDTGEDAKYTSLYSQMNLQNEDF
jgi:hypothetical protein